MCRRPPARTTVYRGIMSTNQHTISESPTPAALWREGLEGGTRADRILFCGDIHDKGKRLCPLVERAADRVDAGIIVLLGDLLNEWGISSAGEIAAFEYLAAWVESQRKSRSVVVLLGNHDLTYYVDSGTPNFRAFAGTCPGFNPAAYPDVHYLLRMMKPRLMFGFTDAAGTGVLASHAGLTHGWYEWMWERLAAADEPRPQSPSAEMIADQIDAFAAGHIGGGIRPFGVMVGRARGGWDTVSPSPCWADMTELAADPLPGFRQVVGHTPVSTVLFQRSVAGACVGNPVDLWFCDTHSLTRGGVPIGDGSMLLVDRATGGAWRVPIADE